jgi:hypothetical protein
MGTFSYNIRAIGLYSGINIKLENSKVKKRFLFPALVTFYKFLKSYLISTIPNILS